MRNAVIILLSCAAFLVQCTQHSTRNAATAPPPVVVECREWSGDEGSLLQVLDDHAGPLRTLSVTSPANGAVLPLDLAPPLFAWRDGPGASLWVVSIAAGDRTCTQVITDRSRWVPDAGLWSAVKRSAGEGALTVTIHGLDNEHQPVSSAGLTLRFSADPLDAALFYLEMPLPFSYGEKYPETFRWRIADPASEDAPRIVSRNLPHCSNCHCVSGDGGLLGMDMDIAGDKGGYVLTEISPEIGVSSRSLISWNDLQGPSGRKSMGLFSRISPTNRYVASTVWERSFFAYLDDVWYSQFFFPIRGALAIYDRDKRSFTPLPGADAEAVVQTCPDWHPDGRSLVFARARPSQALFDVLGDRKVLPTRPTDRIKDLNQQFQLHFDLYRIPFNNGRGGVPEPLPGASDNGSSNYFPRHSPDGKWIVFTRSPNGLAIQPGSELWIVPSKGGRARRMECNLSPMNSWHSWSPNGRWLAFSSKARGPYTRIYLTHVDKNGLDSPPVLLWRLHSPGYACVVPELVPRSLLQVRSIALDQGLRERGGSGREP